MNLKGRQQIQYASLLGQNNIEYIIVPPNCRDCLQPLDVSINKPVKDFIQESLQIGMLRKLWIIRMVALQTSQ